MQRSPYLSYLFWPTLFHLVMAVTCYGIFFSLHSGPWSAAMPRLAIYLAGGILSWTLLEYLLHRFVFHDKHLPAALEDWHKHLVHHQVPESPKEIIAPLQNSAIIAVGVFLLIWGLSRNLLLTLAWFPGMLLGYLAYEWIHFTIHHYPARNPRLKAYFAYHFHHHFKNPKRHFGVTSPLWDLIFRTR